MIRVIGILVLLLFLGKGLNAQDPEISHYMYNYMAINPGYAGSEDELYFTLINRHDFFKFIDTYPMSVAFNANMPFKLFGLSHGVGIAIDRERYTFNSDIRADLSYAYRLNTEAGRFGFGVKLGIFNNSFSGPTWLDPEGGSGDSDPLIPKGSGAAQPNKTSLDVGAGLYYKTDNLYAGISGLHLNSPKMSNSDLFNNNTSFARLRPSIYIFSGYTIQLVNPLFVAKPSVLVHLQGSLMAVNLTGLVEYNKRIWGGVSYRTGSALSALFGIEMINRLRIALSYDIGTNRLMSYGKGSYEIVINYRVNLKVERKPQRYKSIRFL